MPDTSEILLAIHREDAEEARKLIAKLTPRQRDVLVLCAKGASGEETGQRLHISASLVSIERNRLLDTMGVSTMYEAVVIATKAGVC